MTHEALKYPLEKLPPAFMRAWQSLTAVLLVMQSRVAVPLALYRRRIRAAWRVLCGREAYRGAPLLQGEEAIPWQWRLAVALGGSDRALLFIKFAQWIRYNESRGQSPDTYYGYSEWASEHFGHLSDSSIGYHVRALEELGVIVTRRVGRRGLSNAYDQRKSYRIDYGRLNVLLSKVKMPKSEMKSADKPSHEGNSNLNIASQSLNNDSKSPNPSLKTKSLTQSITQEQPTKPTTRGGWRAGAGRKRKDNSPLTETDSHSQASPSIPIPAIVSGFSADVGQSNDLGRKELQDATHPHSEAPFSPLAVESTESAAVIEAEDTPESRLVTRCGTLHLEPDRTAQLLAEYGADRVRAVAVRCEERMQEGKVHSPAGWIVMELKKDIFKCGVLSEAEEMGSAALTVYADASQEADSLPPALDDPAWTALVVACAEGIPELRRAVCWAAGGEYEIAVSGPSVYIPLARHLPAIKQQLAQIVGHAVTLFITVDERLEGEVQA